MSSAPDSERKARRPDAGRPQANGQSDDNIEIEEIEDDDSQAGDASKQHQGPKYQAQTETSPDESSEPEERPRTPAYVAPIGKIGPIPPISPAAGISVPSDRIQLPEYIGRFLVGKKVNEEGDIVDGESHQILARAGGDLPSIVGLAVSNWKGDILGDDGALLGWIEDLELGQPRGDPKSPRTPKSLFELMGQRSAGLMVNQHNELLDPSGSVVGTFYDNNNPQHRKEKEEREARAKEERKERKKQKREQTEREASSSEKPRPSPEDDEGEEEEPKQRARRSESERRQNAESWRKENPGESPSDIFLDVKSTTEGIQLTIRIPTVFGGQQMKPNISFS